MNVLKDPHCTTVSMLSVETLTAALSVFVTLVILNHHLEATLVKVYSHNNIIIYKHCQKFINQ